MKSRPRSVSSALIFFLRRRSETALIETSAKIALIDVLPSTIELDWNSNAPLPVNLLLPTGAQVQISVFNFDAADFFSGGALTVEEFVGA